MSVKALTHLSGVCRVFMRRKRVAKALETYYVRILMKTRKKAALSSHRSVKRQYVKADLYVREFHCRTAKYFRMPIPRQGHAKVFLPRDNEIRGSINQPLMALTHCTRCDGAMRRRESAIHTARDF